MTTKRRGIGLILLGIVLSVVAMFLVMAVIAQGTEPPLPPQVKVLAAGADLAEGMAMIQALEEELVAIASVPVDELPPNAIVVDVGDEETAATYIAVLLGQAVLQEPISEGEILRVDMFSWEFNPIGDIEGNQRAVAVAVDNVTSAGVIVPGDRVDVIVSFSRETLEFDTETGLGKETQARVSQVLLQNVEVLQILERLASEREQGLALLKGDEIVSVVVAILALDLEQATKVSFMATYGDEVRLVLRPPDAPTVPAPEPVTDETFGR